MSPREQLLWALGIVTAVFLVAGLLALVSDWWLERERKNAGLPEPDTIEWRNARSLALYHGKRLQRELPNRRFTT